MVPACTECVTYSPDLGKPKAREACHASIPEGIRACYQQAASDPSPGGKSTMEALIAQFPGIDKLPAEPKLLHKHMLASPRVQKAVKQKDAALDKICSLEDQLAEAQRKHAEWIAEYNESRAMYARLDSELPGTAPGGDGSGPAQTRVVWDRATATTKEKDEQDLFDSIEADRKAVESRAAQLAEKVMARVQARGRQPPAPAQPVAPAAGGGGSAGSADASMPDAAGDADRRPPDKGDDEERRKKHNEHAEQQAKKLKSGAQLGKPAQQG